MSDASSAGSHGKTCRQDVLDRVDIPVVPGAAGRARPMPDRKHEFRKPVPTRRTCLARWKPAVDDDELPSVPLALVFQLATELGPAAVRDCLLLFIRISTAPVRCSHMGSIARFFVKTAEARRTRLRSLCRLASRGTGFLLPKARASSGGHG